MPIGGQNPYITERERERERERGPIGDAERRKQLGLLRDESWAVRIKKGRTSTRTVATGLG